MSFFEKMLKWKILIIVGAFIVFCIGSYYAQYLQMDNTAKVDSILKKTDPVVLDYQEYQSVFGGDQHLLVGIETEGVFTNEILTFLDDLSEKIKTVDGVTDVYSIATMYNIYAEKQGNIDGFKQRDTNRKAQLESIEQYMSEHPLFAGRLLDREGKFTLLQVHFRPTLNEKEEILVNKIKNICAELIEERKLQITFHFVGAPVVSAAIAEAQKKEEFLYPLMLFILCLVLTLVFRRFFGVALPLAVVVMTMTFILACKSLTHSPMSTIDPLLYALITSISVGDAVHIIAAWYNQEFALGTSGRERMITILSELFAPCFLTSITTAIGFGSIAISSIPQIKHFGFFAALGVSFAFLLTIGFIPAMLVGFNRKRRVKLIINGSEHCRRSRAQNFSLYFSSCLARFNIKYAKPVLACFGILFILAGLGMTRIQTGTNPYSFLKDSNPLNISLRLIEEKISGITDLEVILKAEGDKTFRDPELLQEVERLQAYISGLEGITKTDSFLTFPKFEGGVNYENEFICPAQDWQRLSDRSLVSGERTEESSYAYEQNDWINEEYDRLRINCKVANTADLALIQEKIRDFYKIIKEENSNAVTGLTVTGSAVLWERTDKLFITSQIRSLLLALFLISVIMMLLFKSLKLGIFSLIVNVAPILCGLGMLGYTGIHLDMGTVMIAPIAIGIAVDDTIHFLTGFRKYSLQTQELKVIFYEVYKLTLKPIVFTSVILAAGFGSNMLSSFKPNAHFGMISACTLIMAMLCDLFLLPALIVVFSRDRRNE